MKRILILVVLLAGAITSAAYARTLSYGSRGGDVQDLQFFLNSHGYFIGREDGIFGQKTLTGVKRFQANKGLIPDGIVGKKTAAAVYNTPHYNSNRPLADVIRERGSVTEIRIDKTSLTLTLYHGSVPLKSYHVAIGGGGVGDKVRQGDRKTPEGTFYITQKLVLNNDYYLGARWLRISYPNIEDANRGLRDGLIDKWTYDQIVYAINHGLTPPQYTALGGGIGIHGGTGNNSETQGDYWTYGCIGLKDRDIIEFYDYVSVGTRVVIAH